MTVYNLKYPDNYEEVGYVVITGDRVEGRIKKAKGIARKYGCNGIIPKEEEKKERSWQEPVYRTVYETDNITGLPVTLQEIVRYDDDFNPSRKNVSIQFCFAKTLPFQVN